VATLKEQKNAGFSPEDVELWAERRSAWIFDPLLFTREFLGIGICDCHTPDGLGCRLDDIQTLYLKQFCALVRVKHKRSFGKTLSEKERDIADRIGMSIQSGKGVGKTFEAAIIGLWFLVCFQDARVIIMGPGYDQIKTKLWAEISKWMGHAERVFGPNCLCNVLLEKQSDKIFCKHVGKNELGDRWVMFIQTFPKNTDIETQKATIQGNHDKFMLFLIDEASGVPDHIFEPVESTLTDPVNLVFAIFNPNKNTGWAIETQGKMREKWVCGHINAENSSRVTKQQIDYMRKKYGVDSNKYRVSVLGLPPLTDSDALIPWEWIQDAKELWGQMRVEENDVLIHSEDVGGGGDPSMLCRRHGMKALEFPKYENPDTNAVADWFERQAIKHMPDIRIIDANGIGNKQYWDALKKKIWKVIGYKAHQKARRPDCDTLRDELFMYMREAFESRLLGIPDDDELEGELSVLTMSDESGKIRIVSKQDRAFKREMMSRLGYKSPNKADTLAGTFFHDYVSLSKAKENKDKKRRTQNQDFGGLGWMAR